MNYVEIPFDEVAVEVRAKAAIAWGLARKEQGLPKASPTVIRYFRAPVPGESAKIAVSHERDVEGLVDKGTVWIRGDLGPTRVGEVVAHELHHLAHPFRSGSATEIAYLEDLAGGYGKAFARIHASVLGDAPSSQLARSSLKDDSHWTG